jgi:Ni,Fe-hydrogenase III large subunit
VVETEGTAMPGRGAGQGDPAVAGPGQDSPGRPAGGRDKLGFQGQAERGGLYAPGAAARRNVYYVKASNSKNLDRFRVRTPTFANVPPLLKMLPGCDLADVPEMFCRSTRASAARNDKHANGYGLIKAGDRRSPA